MKKQKILIIDDSELNREMLAGMLEEKYDICEAENGEILILRESASIFRRKKKENIL